MEMTIKQNGFSEMSMDEMQSLDGGWANFLWMAFAFAIDGCVVYATGKSVGEWIATGLNIAFNRVFAGL